MTKITKELLADYEDLMSQAGSLGGKIETRIHYVLEKIWSEFGGEIDCWWIRGADEGDVGDLSRALFWGDTVNDFVIRLKQDSDADPVILLKDGSEFGLYDEFPQRWLFEDFEDELTNGRIMFEKKEAKSKASKKAKSAANKAKKAKLKKAAAAKLTPAERKALGI